MVMKIMNNTRMIALFLVLGIPAIGLYLFSFGQRMEEDTIMYIGVFMIFFLSIMASFSIMRTKQIK
jgi:hypothetical protein